MNLWAKIKSAFRNWYGYYEATRITPDRSYIQPIILEPHLDFDACTRIDLISKCQHFERNDAIFNKLADVFEQYTVGPNGLQFIPASSDEDWNQRMADSWAEFGEVCDLSSMQGMGSMQSQSARRWFTDGQVFILKTKGRDRQGTAERAFPRVQLIESSRVSTPPARYVDEGRTIFDGIEIDENGRPLQIWVRDGFNADEYLPRQMSEIIQIFEPARPGMLHGQPFLTSGINDLLDLRNLQYLENLAAKENAEKANVIKTESGELNPAMVRERRFNSETKLDSQGNEVAATRLENYRKVLGARTIALKKGESIDVFQSNRPSVAAQQHWDYLTSRVCASCGISKQLVFPWSIQGTIARMDLDAQAMFFRCRSAVLATAWKRVYLWYASWAVGNDPRLKDKPGDWKAVSVRYPRAVNVDNGRNSRALISEYEAGIQTLEMICGPMGEDWRKVIRQRGKEEAFIDRVAKEEGTTPARIKASIAAAMKAEAAVEAANQDQNKEQEQEQEQEEAVP